MKINKTVKIKAIKGSIKKWKHILFNNSIDYGTNNCPLYHRFLNKKTINACKLCPVYKVTGLNYCCGSPYQKWSNHQSIIHNKFFPPFEIFDTTKPQAATLSRYGRSGMQLLYQRVPGTTSCLKCTETARQELFFLQNLITCKTRRRKFKK